MKEIEEEKPKKFTLEKTPLLVLIIPSIVSFILVSLVAILFLTRS